MAKREGRAKGRAQDGELEGRAAKPAAIQEKRRRPRRSGALVAALLIVGALGYGAWVTLSNGTLLRVDFVARHDGGAWTLSCDADPGVCDGSRLMVDTRDRVYVSLTVLGSDAEVTLRLGGDSYQIWPAGLTITARPCADPPCATEAFTAWSAGTFPVVGSVDGEPEPSLQATLVVA